MGNGQPGEGFELGTQVKPMRCRKARELISLYLAPDESWLSPKDRQALEAHMAVCEPCHRDCRESRDAIGMLRDCWQISADSVILLKNTRRQERHGVSSRIIRLFGASRRVAAWAVAACLVIGVLGRWAFLNRRTCLPGPSRSVAFTSQDLPLVIESADGARIASEAIVQTLSRETKHLVLNNKHQVVMNAGTRLSIEPFVKAGRIGCLVSLALGEVYVHVEHDGNPFAVQTPHGRAVITGTTFDVKATDAGTTLVVVEGSVRFELEKGLVEVTSGQISKIIAHSAPASPVSCNADELTAWATAYELKPALAKIKSIWDDYDLTDLGISAISGPIELERIDYETWIEEKRAWFEREFPWTAQLRNALTAEGIEADYPELLMSSGDIWRFVYPPAGQDRLLAADDAAIIKAADHHGKNVQWLKDRCLVPVARTTTDRQKQMKDAFTLWQNELAAAVDSREEVPRELFLDSLHACAYLRQTRSLVWLAVEAGRYSLPDMPRAQLQALLQAEVTAADRGVNDVIRLLATERSMLLCDSDLYRQLVRRLCEAIAQMTQMEERLADEIADRHP